ncbi:MAG: hypothetical protein WKF65_10220 [Gaiellaceae bacterium]
MEKLVARLRLALGEERYVEAAAAGEAGLTRSWRRYSRALPVL